MADSQVTAVVEQANALTAEQRRAVPLTRIASRAMLAAFLVMLGVPHVVAANHVAPCGDPSTVHTFTGNEVSYGNNQGVRAYIEPENLTYCTTSGDPADDEERSSDYWVAILGPGPYDIVQLGVTRCRNPLASICDGTLNIGWAWGRAPSSPGCQGMTTKIPNAQDKGAAPTAGSNLWSVKHTAAGAWEGNLNSTLKGATLDTNICWSKDYMSWFTETWDYGDAHGYTVTDPLGFSALEGQASTGGTWMDISIGGSATPCDFVAPAPVFHCDITSSFQFNVWTDR